METTSLAEGRDAQGERELGNEKKVVNESEMGKHIDRKEVSEEVVMKEKGQERESGGEKV